MEKFSNNATTTLSLPLDKTSTELTVQAGTGVLFPTLTNSNDYFYVTIVSNTGQMEIVKCTARNVDVFTIQRAQQGTKAVQFLAGSIVQHRLTAAFLNSIAPVVSSRTISITGDVTGSTTFGMTGNIVIKTSIPTFTPPTESAPGQAGLVPGPGATGEIPHLLRYLAADADWGEFSRHNFAVDPTVANGRELVLAGTSHPEGLDANTIGYGTYISVALSNTPTESGTLIAIPTFRSKDSYGVTQLFFSYGSPTALRTTLSSVSVPMGSLPKSEHWGSWIYLGAPTPTAATGVGQWRYLYTDGSRQFTLPSGGVWAYFVLGLSGSGVVDHNIDVKGGGTTTTLNNSQVNMVRGFGWRIA